MGLSIQYIHPWYCGDQTLWRQTPPSHLFLEQRPSHRSTTDSPAWTPRFLHQDTEHRIPTGMSVKPTPYSLYAADCRPAHTSNTINKFVDDSTVVRLITEAEHKDEVFKLSPWCQANNLIPNTFRRLQEVRRWHPPSPHTQKECGEGL